MISISYPYLTITGRSWVSYEEAECGGKWYKTSDGQIYELDTELLHDLISLPHDIHNQNPLSLVYTP